MIETDVIVGAGMKVVCARDELVQRLAVVSRALSTRSAVQILSGILLKAENGERRLAATDMEVSLRAAAEAQVSDEGTVVVPGRLLLDIARSLPDSDVTIEHKPEEAVVVITAGSANYRLHTYSNEDFPRLPEIVSDHVVNRFQNLQKIMRAGLVDLTEVEGVGEVRARAIKEGLSRLAETSILERYV